MYQKADIQTLKQKGGALGSFFSQLFPTEENNCFFAINMEKYNGKYYLMSFTAVEDVKNGDSRTKTFLSDIKVERSNDKYISGKYYHVDRMAQSTKSRRMTKGSRHEDCSAVFELRTRNLVFQVEVPGGRCATIEVSREILNGENFHGKKFSHRNKPIEQLSDQQIKSRTIIESSIIESAKSYSTPGNGGGSICEHKRRRSLCKDLSLIHISEPTRPY